MYSILIFKFCLIPISNDFYDFSSISILIEKRITENMEDQILTIIIAAVVSSIMSGLIGWFIQSDGYKKEYHKKIIDKRLNAYDAVEKMLIELRTINRLKLTNIDCHSFMLGGPSRYLIFYNTFVFASSYIFWFSPELRDKILKFNIFIIREISNKTTALSTEEDFYKLGVKHFLTLRIFRDDFERIVFDDFKNFDDIKSFMKYNRNPDSQNNIPFKTI